MLPTYRTIIRLEVSVSVHIVLISITPIPPVDTKQNTHGRYGKITTMSTRIVVIITTIMAIIIVG